MEDISTHPGDVTFRDEVLPTHRDHVRRIVESSGFFHATLRLVWAVI